MNKLMKSLREEIGVAERIDSHKIELSLSDAKELLRILDTLEEDTEIKRIESMTLSEFNKNVKEALSDYYKERTSENFFRIDSLLKVCQKHDFTKESVPQLIEMQNVIVMG